MSYYYYFPCMKIYVSDDLEIAKEVSLVAENVQVVVHDGPLLPRLQILDVISTYYYEPHIYRNCLSYWCNKNFCFMCLLTLFLWGIVVVFVMAILFFTGGLNRRG